MNSRERILAACRCQPVDQTPVWMMRQAGRFLPEYRELRQKHDFLNLVRTPELAREVTLQPLRRFPLDAAILFSDILVIPEALGQPYSFRDRGGIALDFALEQSSDLKRLQVPGAVDRLSYVFDAIRLLRSELGNDKALLGFGGSPWTLACYMIAGGSDPNCLPARRLFRLDPVFLSELLSLLSDLLAEYFLRKIEAGVDAIQIFDSWAALCPTIDYQEMSLKWIQRIIDQLPRDFPVIVFAKGMAHRWQDIQKAGATVVSCDWTTPVADFRKAWHEAGLAWQGNLDPVVLTTDRETVIRETKRVLDLNQGLPGHIFNLGHGMIPQALPELVPDLCETIRANTCQSL